jgi:alkylhydroperoxidase family enzyme
VDPWTLHEGAAETWSFIRERVLESGVVDQRVKDLALAYVRDPDSVDVDAYEGRERAALEWAHAIVWDADAATDELWERLHAHFSEPELVDLGCAVGFELGRTHFLRTLGGETTPHAATA